ncbi:unnamed protein product [Prunus armeniaca]|uniref:Uncharacterized protein n=1 Tax=Prunus armeniaca TaxID=36596 RepID=A0A6J5XF59_PRUAR|nr:unnamed protein product [Prunus armeniaca]
MECEEVVALVSGETEHCRKLPPSLVSHLFPRMRDHSETSMLQQMLKWEPGGVMNVCEGLGVESDESSKHGQVGVEDLDPLQALRLGLELSAIMPWSTEVSSVGTMRMVAFGGDGLPIVEKNENAMPFVPVPTDGAKCYTRNFGIVVVSQSYKLESLYKWERREMWRKGERVAESTLFSWLLVFFEVPFQQEEGVPFVGEQQLTSTLGPADVAAH